LFFPDSVLVIYQAVLLEAVAKVDKFAPQLCESFMRHQMLRWWGWLIRYHKLPLTMTKGQPSMVEVVPKLNPIRVKAGIIQAKTC
jgi:hypothetical protein